MPVLLGYVVIERGYLSLRQMGNLVMILSHGSAYTSSTILYKSALKVSRSIASPRSTSSFTSTLTEHMLYLLSYLNSGSPNSEKFTKNYIQNLSKKIQGDSKALIIEN